MGSDPGAGRIAAKAKHGSGKGSGGFAILGTTEIRNLGRAVSHGCVRLHPANAQTLFNLVRKYGPGNRLITTTR